jgi:hypothetical protein
LPAGFEHTGGFEGHKEKPARYWHPSLVRNGQYVPTKPNDYGPDLFTDSLIDFIRRNKDKPFCAYYSMCQTHAPWVSTPDSTQSASDRTGSSKANFQANVEYVDKLVGRLIDTLAELKLRERTIVIFTGDKEGSHREWIFSYLGDRRVLRDKRWLLEDNSPLHSGRLYDCGANRNGEGYRDVSDSQDPEALAARARFDKLLVDLPAPIIEDAGSAKAKKPERARARAKAPAADDLE